jgi:hypothetical protein
MNNTDTNINPEFEERMKRMMVERAAKMEQVQPGYWQDVAAAAKECGLTREVTAII